MTKSRAIDSNVVTKSAIQFSSVHFFIQVTYLLYHFSFQYASPGLHITYQNIQDISQGKWEQFISWLKFSAMG